MFHSQNGFPLLQYFSGVFVTPRDFYVSQYIVSIESSSINNYHRFSPLLSFASPDDS